MIVGKSHNRSIGEIEETNPWRETTYWFGRRLSPLVYLVHWESPHRSPFSSHLGVAERHTWRLHMRGVRATFIMKYGQQEAPL